MFTKSKFQKVISMLFMVAVLLSSFQAPVASAQSGDDGERQVHTQKSGDGLKRQVNVESGKVSFIGPESGRVLPASKALGTLIRPQDPALALVNRYAPEFGIKDPARELSVMKNKQSDDGHISVRYQQKYQGIPVLGGELIVNTNTNGDLYSMNGEVSTDLALPTQPEVDSAQATQTALQALAKYYQKTPADFVASAPELWIFDESLLQPSTRPVELVWRMEVTSKELGMPVRELVLVNAQRGNISLHFNQIDMAWEGAPEEKASSGSKVTQEDFKSGHEQYTTNLATEHLPSLTGGATWYVTTTGNDTNNCATTSTPCATIQRAIGKAAVLGDTIKVAQGLYTGTGNQVVLLNKNVNLSGGWTSTFDLQNGFSNIDGEKTKIGIAVGDMTTPAVNTQIDHFIVENGTDGIYAICSCDQIKVFNSAFIYNTQTGINAFGIL